MRARILLAGLVVLSGCAVHRAAKLATPGGAAAPVVVAETVREAAPNDYLRISFLPAGVEPTSLSRPGAFRAFATATPLYRPPLRVEDLPYYSGLVNDDTRVLVAMRCRPPDAAKVDAVLATWPNVFAAVVRDMQVSSSDCDAAGPDAAREVACYARGFSDPAETAVPAALARTFDYAKTIYDGNHVPMEKWLQAYYGIYPAFAGTGYSVKDSYSLRQQPMTSQQILVKSVSSEYLLKNVSLNDAGCRCIAVPPYTGRARDPLDPEFIEESGGDGVCKPVNRLGTAHKR
jgi:hypothetical protein